MGLYYSTPVDTTPKTSIPINGHVRLLNVRRSKYSPKAKFLTIEKIDKATINYAVDLSQTCKVYPTYDQGQLGSCTANGICGAYWFDVLNRDLSDKEQSYDPDFVPSRLYLYYQERAKEGTIPTDSGAEISDGFGALETKGVCSESKWPYDISKFTNKPTDDCDTDANGHRAVTTRRVAQTLDDLVLCLNAKFPIVMGCNLYKSFESIGSDGVVSMPKENEQVLGGHCMVIFGYDPDRKMFKVRNSWGDNWGDRGYCYFPENYLLDSNLAYDFSIVTSIIDESTIANRLRSGSKKTFREMLLKKNRS